MIGFEIDVDTQLTQINDRDWSEYKMKSLVLYNKPECPFCWKVRLALSEAKLDVKLIDSLIDAERNVWLALTPKKTVPVLVINNDLVIYESNVILEYFSEITGYLLPRDPSDRIIPRLINYYSDSLIGSALKEIIFEKRNKEEHCWDHSRIQAGITAFHKALIYLSETLESREFFGKDYSIAECALTARIGLAESYGVEIPERFSNLRDWYSRMKERPSFDATLPSKSIVDL